MYTHARAREDVYRRSLILQLAHRRRSEGKRTCVNQYAGLGKQYEEEIRSDHGTDMKGRKIRFAIGVTLLVISGLSWLLLLISGTSYADQSAGVVVLGGLIISAIPIGVGVWLVRGRSSGESAPSANGLADLTSASPPAVELSRFDTPLVAMPAGKTGESGLRLSGLNLAWYEWALVLLPIVLVIPGFTGGWLGGAAFGAGFVLSLRIMRSDPVATGSQSSWRSSSLLGWRS